MQVTQFRPTDCRTDAWINTAWCIVAYPRWKKNLLKFQRGYPANVLETLLPVHASTIVEFVAGSPYYLSRFVSDVSEKTFTFRYVSDPCLFLPTWFFQTSTTPYIHQIDKISFFYCSENMKILRQSQPIILSIKIATKSPCNLLQQMHLLSTKLPSWHAVWQSYLQGKWVLKKLC